MSLYVLVTWQYNGTDENGFLLQRSIDTGSTWPVDIPLFIQNQYLDYPIPTGSYCYRVAAINDFGTGTFSNTASITFNSSISSIPLSYTPATDIITWTDIDGVDNGNLTYFHNSASKSTVTDISINNQSITSLIIGNELPNLINLSCYSNALLSLDMSYTTTLQQIECYENNLSSLDVTNNLSLTYLDCYDNNLSSLDVTNNLSLTYLDCDTNPIGTLDVTNNTQLTNLYCNDNGLSVLDVSNNSLMISLDCNSNSLITLDVTNLTVLKYLVCTNNVLTSLLGVNNNSNLILLWAQDNQLTSVDISNNLALPYVDIHSNLLTQGSVDTLLSQLVANGVNGPAFAYFNGTGNASPTGGLLNVDRQTLLNPPRSWNTVAVN